MKQWLKRNIGLIYISVLTVVLVILLLTSDELPDMIKALSELNVVWVWISALCMIAYLMLRAVTLNFYLKSRGCALKFYEALTISGIGQFYSAVTPSASGGQPLQVLAMHQRGIPISIGTATVSIKFIGFQLAFMLMGGVLWGTHMHMVANQLGGVRWLVAFGYLMNSILIFVVAMTMVNQSVVDRLVNWGINIGIKLRLIRDGDKVKVGAKETLEEYRNSLLTLRNRPMDGVVVLLLSFAQVFFLMVVVCCLYHAFRLSGTDDASILTLQLLLFITAAFVPLPGAAGAQEGGFYFFFRGIIPEDSIVALMVCWRFFTYYFLLIMGLMAVIADGVTRRMWKKKGGGESDA